MQDELAKFDGQHAMGIDTLNPYSRVSHDSLEEKQKVYGNSRTAWLEELQGGQDVFCTLSSSHTAVSPIYLRMCCVEIPSHGSSRKVNAE